jgi:predicted PhzF superfamily epimerase YddE/YHI9
MSPFIVNIITTSSSNQDAVFFSRMFAPIAGVHEDYVCGSAHCLLGPYWAQKKGLEGNAMKAKQVSRRGGDLELRWDKDKNTLYLAGQQKVVARGEVYL